MKVLIAGAGGLVGSALCGFLKKEGHRVSTLTRGSTAHHGDVISWNPQKGRLDLLSIEGFDAVVNLAGENIASGRWSAGKKKAILESRTAATTLLATSLGKLEAPPKVFLNASAIGFYGNRGEELLDESSTSGTGFLAGVCRSWEAAAHPAIAAHIRTVFLRTGVVLSAEGGALQKMLFPFKCGLGGRVGSGEQFVSWIAIDDLVRIILFCLETDSIVGAVNAVAPSAVTNKQLTQALGKALGRPTLLPLPAWLVRMLFGEMGEELLLASTRVKPQKLIDNNYRFLHATIGDALSSILFR